MVPPSTARPRLSRCGSSPRTGTRRTTAPSPPTIPAPRPSRRSRCPTGRRCCGPSIACRGRPGPAFHPELETDAADLILRKGFRPEIDSYSAFFENDRKTPTGLAGYLRERGVAAALARRAGDRLLRRLFGDRRAGRGLRGDAARGRLPRAIDLDGSLAAAMREMAGRGVGFARAEDLPAG